MLYEVITGFVLECVLRDAEGASRQRKIMDGYFAVLFPFEQTRFSRFLDTRITSYNVCYTKLLRPVTIDSRSPK